MLFAHGEAFHREPLVYDYTGNFPLSDVTENGCLPATRAAGPLAGCASSAALHCWLKAHSVRIRIRIRTPPHLMEKRAQYVGDGVRGRFPVHELQFTCRTMG